MLKNIVVLLLVSSVAFGVGIYYGFLEGKNVTNDWLVVSTWNAGFIDGYSKGYSTSSKEIIHVLFYEGENPYKWRLPTPKELKEWNQPTEEE